MADFGASVAAIGSWLAANSSAIAAGSSLASTGMGVYAATRKAPGSRPGLTPVSAKAAASTPNDEAARRRFQQRKAMSVLTRDLATPTLGESALMGA